MIENTLHLFICKYSVVFIIPRSRHRFADGIRKNCKEVADPRFVHPNAAQLYDICVLCMTYLVYKLVRTQLSLFTTFHVFLFQFVFVLPGQVCPHAQFYGKIKSASHGKADKDSVQNIFIFSRMSIEG